MGRQGGCVQIGIGRCRRRKQRLSHGIFGAKPSFQSWRIQMLFLKRFTSIRYLAKGRNHRYAEILHSTSATFLGIMLFAVGFPVE
ncbi:hypothetical protein B0H12DRAFT_100704 [Mycena haematopus]|nr:hypothetical protein B0H12DRAFT_100704 [Mycena haematopus]